MAEETLRDVTAGLAGLTLQGVSDIQASLTEGKVPEDLVLGFNSEDPQIRKASVIKIREIVQNHSPSEAAQPVIDAGLVPAIVSLLDSEDTSFQCAAACIVANIFSGPTRQAEQVTDAGVIPRLVILSASPNADVADQAVWALDTILGDRSTSDAAQLVIDNGLVPAIVSSLDSEDTSLQCAAACIVANIFSGPTRQAEQVTDAGVIPKLFILSASPNADVADQAVWALDTILGDVLTSDAVQLVIDNGLVPAIISSLDSEEARLQLGGAHILTNIAATGTPQQIEQVMDAGAIPKLIALSASPDADVADQAVWALGNVAASSARLRDRVEEEGGVAALVKLVARGEPGFKNVQRRAVGAIYRYLNPEHSRKIPITRIKNLLPCLTRYVQETCINEANMESIEDAVRALHNIGDHGLQRTDFIATGVVPRLVKLLADSSSSITLQKQALMCLGYVVCGSEEGIDVAVDAGLLPELLVALETKNQSLYQLALWTAANVADGSPSQVYALLDSGLLKPAVRVLMDDQEPPICRPEACWTISNLTMKFSGDAKVRQALIEERCVEALSAALLTPNCRVVEFAVFGINNVLEWKPSQGSEADESPITMLRSASGPQNLRAVRDSRDVHDGVIRRRCQNLLTQYFPDCSRPARV